MGVSWTIVGHSERRGKGESNGEVAAKAKFAVDKGLKVMACCGEPLESHQAGTTNDFVFPQIKAYADVFTADDWKNVVIAYEPIWAIGTGLTATPQQAQDTHKAIREYLGKVVSADVAANTRILYGGSATAKTAPDLASQPDIDGFLVGGASLKPEFTDIVNCQGSLKTLKPVNIGINGFGRYVFVAYNTSVPACVHVAYVMSLSQQHRPVGDAGGPKRSYGQHCCHQRSIHPGQLHGIHVPVRFNARRLSRHG
jgi:glyceraldehyde 3-phosphate dehydrogenase